MIGVEHEWADVDRWATIPPHLGKWSEEDYSIVNSDGHANCPTGKTWRWGGEVNTRPTDTAAEQAEITQELVYLLNPTILYKCNTHVHVSPSVSLLGDLDLLKRVARYLRDAEDFVYSTVEPLSCPTIEDFSDDDELRGAMKRWRRNLGSHQHRVPDARWSEMMSATTVQEFKDAHAPPTHTGGRAWHVTKRAGMNLRSLWKHGTIEYRHFHGSSDPVEIESAAEWCRLFTEAAIVGSPTPREIWESRSWTMPRPRRYQHQLQLGFERTKHK